VKSSKLPQKYQRKTINSFSECPLLVIICYRV
jgi:hypothetical protein